MTRLSHFRAEIETDRGSVSRLAYHGQMVTLNDREIGIELQGSGGKERPSRWAIRFRSVSSISQGGAVFGDTFAGMELSSDDIADLRSGRARLVIVREGEG